MEYRYQPKGVCAKEFCFQIEDGVITNVEVQGGCPGNLLGIGKLLTGKKLDEVIAMFRGLRCAERPTSCPDQMAQALEQYLTGAAQPQ